jgi:Tfp pilus assembly protein PilN
MIEINLLPGAKKAKRGAGVPSINFAAIGAAISARVKDKYLASAVGSAILAVVVVGFLFISQRNRESDLRAAEAKAVADSTRFASIMLQRARALARRDSAVIQLNLIKAIDEDRYIWPHLMEEVSRALPIYTWLRNLALTGTPQGTRPAASVVRMPPLDTGKTKRKKPLAVRIPRDPVRVRMIGRTVDIQALTRFMRSLEDSPFLGSVQLNKSELAIDGGKELTQFTLDMAFVRPDTLLLRRVPFTVTSR